MGSPNAVIPHARLLLSMHQCIAQEQRCFMLKQMVLTKVQYHKRQNHANFAKINYPYLEQK